MGAARPAGVVGRGRAARLTGGGSRGRRGSPDGKKKRKVVATEMEGRGGERRWREGAGGTAHRRREQRAARISLNHGHSERSSTSDGRLT